MAKAKTAPKLTERDIFAQMFPDIPMDDEPEPAKATGSEPAKSPDLAALEARLTEMSSQMDLMRRENLALTQQARVEMPPQVQTEVDFSKLPDPAIDGEAYNRALQAQVNAVLKGREALADWETRQRTSQSTQVEKLWDNFSTSPQYAPYSENRKRVEIAAKEVAERAAAEGRDVQKYMFTTQGQFMQDVVREYDTLFGKPTIGDDEDDPSTSADRATEMFGGAESGGRPSRRETPSNDMFSDIRSWQAKSGFHM